MNLHDILSPSRLFISLLIWILCRWMLCEFCRCWILQVHLTQSLLSHASQSQFLAPSVTPPGCDHTAKWEKKSNLSEYVIETPRWKAKIHATTLQNSNTVNISYLSIKQWYISLKNKSRAIEKNKIWFNITPTTLILIGDKSCFAFGVSSCRQVSYGDQRKVQQRKWFPEKWTKPRHLNPISPQVEHICAVHFKLIDPSLFISRMLSLKFNQFSLSIPDAD